MNRPIYCAIREDENNPDIIYAYKDGHTTSAYVKLPNAKDGPIKIEDILAWEDDKPFKVDWMEYFGHSPYDNEPIWTLHQESDGATETDEDYADNTGGAHHYKARTSDEIVNEINSILASCSVSNDDFAAIFKGLCQLKEMADER